MSDLDELSKRYRSLTESLPQEAGEHVEANLLKGFRAHHHRRQSLLLYWLPVAAMFVLAVALSLVFTHRAGRPGQLRAPVHSNLSAVQQPAAYGLPGFVPLPYSQSGVPVGQAVVMRVQLSGSDLGLLGVPVPAASRRERIGADVLVGQDGVARAVRFIP